MALAPSGNRPRPRWRSGAAVAKRPNPSVRDRAASSTLRSAPLRLAQQAWVGAPSLAPSRARWRRPSGCCIAYRAWRSGRRHSAHLAGYPGRGTATAVPARVGQAVATAEFAAEHALLTVHVAAEGVETTAGSAAHAGVADRVVAAGLAGRAAANAGPAGDRPVLPRRNGTATPRGRSP